MASNGNYVLFEIPVDAIYTCRSLICVIIGKLRYISTYLEFFYLNKGDIYA